MIICDRCKRHQAYQRFIPKHVIPEDFFTENRECILARVDLCNECIRTFNELINDFAVTMKDKIK